MPTAIDDSRRNGLYRSYANDNTYDLRTGVVVIPVADGPAVAINVHRPYSIRTQRWSAKKSGTPPVIPGPSRTDTLIGHAVSVPLPVWSGSRPTTYAWAVSGAYVYLENLPHTTGYAPGLKPVGFKPAEQKVGFPAGRYPFQFDDLQEQQKTVGGRSDWDIRKFLAGLAALAGGVAFAIPLPDDALGAVNVPISTGSYFWPHSVLPACFFDPSLS